MGKQSALHGQIVGIARNVTETSQLADILYGVAIQSVQFDLVRREGRPLRVQIRGSVIHNEVRDGDEIVVDAPSDGSLNVQADRVFNRTTNSFVEAPKGWSSFTARTEALHGKGAARAHRGLAVGVIAFVAFIFVAVIGVFIFIGYKVSTIDSGPPSSWCEQAKEAGIDDTPGC